MLAISFAVLAGCVASSAMTSAAVAFQAGPGPGGRVPSVAAWNLSSYTIQAVEWPRGLLEESAMGDSADRSGLGEAAAFFTFTVRLGDEVVTAGVELAPVRSAAFKQYVDRGAANVVAGVADSVVPARELSYLGTIDGKPGARVAVNFVGGAARAVIDLGPGVDGVDGGWWFVQAAKEADAAWVDVKNGAGVYVAYSGVPGQMPAGYRCGGQLTPPVGFDAHLDEEPSPEGPTCNRLADIAIDADFTFYTANGSSTVTTQADLDSVMNGTRLIYARDTNILFNTSATIIRTTNTLYATSNINSLLNAVQSEWQTNQTAVTRDLVHLFTGQPTGGTIGVAYLGVVCSTFAYGVSNSRFTTNLNNRIGLTAHEIGHNFNGQHCDGDSDCFIMCSSIGGCSGNVTRFGLRSVTAIKAHAAGRPCMTNTGAFATAVGPRAVDDSGSAGTVASTIDVLANDTDANCQTLAISAFSATSVAGAVISRSVGTGPGGRDRLTYTPVIGNPLTDSFTYTASDGALTGVGTVRVLSTQTRNPDVAGATRAGLDVRYYATTGLSNLPNFALLTPYLTSSTANINIASTTGVFADSGRVDNVSALYTGFVTVPLAAQYTFFTESDDGSRLFIGPHRVVDNNGLHGMVERSGVIALKAGTHAIRVEFFEAGGGAGLIARWSSTGGIVKAVIPAANLVRPVVACNLADVASDGLDVVYNPNGTLGPEDLDAFIGAFIEGNVAVADVASDSLDTVRNPNGAVGAEDLDAFIGAFVAGC